MDSNTIAIILGIALVVTNIIWISFIKSHIRDERLERWQLMERIRQPEAEHVPIGDLIGQMEQKSDPEPINVNVDAEPKFTEEPPIDEADLVGRISPDMPLRSDDSGDNNGSE